MNISRLWSIAVAEMRSCRRLARTWVITTLAMICGSIAWLFLTLAHMFSSYVSASAGLKGPHFAISHIGKLTLLSFTVGIVFLAFDIQQRDMQTRIQESIDARPMSNFELISGRLIGIVILLAIPVFTLIFLMCVYGIIAEISGLGFGSAVDPISVAAFLVWDIVPNLMFWGATTMLVALLVRYRILAVVIMLALLLGYYFLSSQIPFYLASALTTYSGSDSLPSALVPQFFNADVIFNRICVLTLTIGLLGLTSTIYPCLAKVRERYIFAVTGCTAVLLATCGIYALVNSNLRALEQTEHWAAIHQQYQTHSETNIERISGNIEIKPGRSINLDLVLNLTTSLSDSEENWLFSLNPGYDIVDIELNGRKIQDYSFKDGLLTIPKNGLASSPVDISLVAKGVPDSSFAYLDSSLKWRDLDFTQALSARRFGTKSYIFHPQFVALVPGVSWLPTSGAAYGRSQWGSRPTDFFEVDLQVSIPKNWIVAGPGSRTLVEDDKRTKYRFNPSNPISEVALIASNFEQRSLAVAGITFELLMSTKHTKNLKTLESVVPALTKWIEEKIVETSELGLTYPFDTLTFVEVPHSLRTYGGGWRMDSVFSPPGIQMYRESGLPIARFDYIIDSQSSELTEDDEELGEFILELLQDFFANDFEGGNPLQNLGRNLVSHQTKPTGPGAIAMEHFVGELANKLVSDVDGYFSIHSSLEGNRASELANLVIEAGGGFGSTPTLENLEWRERFIDRPSVWEYAVKNSLSTFDFEQDALNSFHALLLRSDANRKLLLDVSSQEEIGSFLRDLVIKYRGTTYTEAGLYESALNVGLDLRYFLGNWLHNADIPGFILANAQLEILENPDQNESSYQSRFLIRNDEAVNGYVTISYGDEGDSGFHELEPLRIPSKTTLQIAIQSVDHPRHVLVHPYFSKNRNPMRLDITEHHDDIPITSGKLPYITEVDWIPQEANVIIVDDLDESFSAAGGEDPINRPLLPKWITYLLGNYDMVLETDHGLLQYEDASDKLSKDPFTSFLWYRESDPTSYGRYRRTYVISFQQVEQTQLTFSADIPTAGNWKLEFHMPDIKWKNYRTRFSPGFGSIYYMSRNFVLASVDLDIENAGISKSITFDAQAESNGWNELGVFDLDVGPVDVVLTPQSDGITVGDAIKWTPVDIVP